MAQLVVRNLDEGVKRRLKERARRNGRSMEAEARDIIGNALPALDQEKGLGTRIAEMFKEFGLKEGELQPLPRSEVMRSPFDDDRP